MDQAEMEQRLYDMRRRSWEARKLGPYQSIWEALRFFLTPSWRWLVALFTPLLMLVMPVFLHRRVDWTMFAWLLAWSVGTWFAVALIVGLFGWIFNERRFRPRPPKLHGEG